MSILAAISRLFTPVDHVRDPAADAFAATAGIVAVGPAAGATHRGRVDVQARDGTVGPKLSGRAMDIQRRHRGANSDQRATLGLGGGSRHCAGGIPEELVHIFQADPARFGVEKVYYIEGKIPSVSTTPQTRDSPPRGVVGERLTEDKTTGAEEGVDQIQAPFDRGL